jgi:hypothetical protein
LFWMALFFLITHRLAALLWFRWPAWRCNSCTVSDPALVNGMSPEPLIPTGVLAVGQNAGHQVLVKVLCGWRGMAFILNGSRHDSHEPYSLGPT